MVSSPTTASSWSCTFSRLRETLCFVFGRLGSGHSSQKLNTLIWVPRYFSEFLQAYSIILLWIDHDHFFQHSYKSTIPNHTVESILYNIYIWRRIVEEEEINTHAFYSGDSRFESQAKDYLSWCRVRVIFLSHPKHMLWYCLQDIAASFNDSSSSWFLIILLFDGTVPLTNCMYRIPREKVTGAQSNSLPLMQPKVLYQSLLPILTLMNPVHVFTNISLNT
jgi:hypothetical protein